MYISVIQAIDKFIEGTTPNGLSSILLSRQPHQGPALSKKKNYTTLQIYEEWKMLTSMFFDFFHHFFQQTYVYPKNILYLYPQIIYT